MPAPNFKLAKDQRPWYAPKGVERYRDLGLPDFITQALESEILPDFQLGDLVPIVGQMKEGSSLPETLLRDRPTWQDKISLPGEILGALGIGPKFPSRKSGSPTSPHTRQIFQGEREGFQTPREAQGLDAAYATLDLDKQHSPAYNLKAREYVRQMTGWEFDPTTGKFIIERPDPKLSDMLAPEVIAKLDDPKGLTQSFDSGNIEGKINHPYFKRYDSPDSASLDLPPDTADLPRMPKRIDLGKEGTNRGGYDPAKKTINAKGVNTDEAYSILLHELNHKSLMDTGGPQGANSQYILLNDRDRVHQFQAKAAENALKTNSQLSSLLPDDPNFTQKQAQLTKRRDAFATVARDEYSAAYVAYLYNRGETLSRATQSRRALTPDQREKIPMSKHLEFQAKFGDEMFGFEPGDFDQWSYQLQDYSDHPSRKALQEFATLKNIDEMDLKGYNPPSVLDDAMEALIPYKYMELGY